MNHCETCRYWKYRAKNYGICGNDKSVDDFPHAVDLLPDDGFGADGGDYCAEPFVICGRLFGCIHWEQWEAVHEPSPPMTFMEAVAATESGQRVRQKRWVSGMFVSFCEASETLVYDTGREATFAYHCIKATDWEIVE